MSNAHASGLDRTLHNLKNGFLQGVLRGCHRGLLSMHDYSKLMVCETLDDVKTLLVTFRWGRYVFVSYLNLDVLQCSTDYRTLIQDLPSPLHSSTIVSTCTQKMVNDFNIFRSQVGISAPKIIFFTPAFSLSWSHSRLSTIGRRTAGSVSGPFDVWPHDRQRSACGDRSTSRT